LFQPEELKAMSKFIGAIAVLVVLAATPAVAFQGHGHAPAHSNTTSGDGKTPR
jgi:hypothetical protein